jgi:hypothetical protein
MTTPVKVSEEFYSLISLEYPDYPSNENCYIKLKNRSIHEADTVSKIVGLKLSVKRSIEEFESEASTGTLCVFICEYGDLIKIGDDDLNLSNLFLSIGEDCVCSTLCSKTSISNLLQSILHKSSSNISTEENNIPKHKKSPQKKTDSLVPRNKCGVCHKDVNNMSLYCSALKIWICEECNLKIFRSMMETR